MYNCHVAVAIVPNQSDLWFWHCGSHFPNPGLEFVVSRPAFSHLVEIPVRMIPVVSPVTPNRSTFHHGEPDPLWDTFKRILWRQLLDYIYIYGIIDIYMIIYMIIYLTYLRQWSWIDSPVILGPKPPGLVFGGLWWQVVGKFAELTKISWFSWRLRSTTLNILHTLLWVSCTIDWDWDMIYLHMYRTHTQIYIYIIYRPPLHSSPSCVRAAKVENLIEYRNPPQHGVAAGDSSPRCSWTWGNMKLMIEGFTLRKMLLKCWDNCAWFSWLVLQHLMETSWLLKSTWFRGLRQMLLVVAANAS